MTSPVDTLKALVDAVEAEFCGEATERLEPDDSKVSYPEDRCHITFGHIRRAKAAIAALSGGEAINVQLADEIADGLASLRSIDGLMRRDLHMILSCKKPLYTTPRIPDGIDGQVIALLVAGGFVSQAKVDEARNIAISATPGDEGRGEQRAKPFDYRKHYPPMQPDCNGRATTGQTPEDWIERAARCAEEILQCELADIPAREESKSIEHLAWMAMKLAAKDVGSATKTCRWLGYLQGALVTFGYSTLETEKKRNLRSVAPPAAPREE